MKEMIKNYFEIETKEDVKQVVGMSLTLIGGCVFFYCFMWFLYYMGAFANQY